MLRIISSAVALHRQQVNQPLGLQQVGKQTPGAADQEPSKGVVHKEIRDALQESYRIDLARELRGAVKRGFEGQPRP